MSELKDRIIGGFRILQEIQSGSGSQGTVHKAECIEDVHGLTRVGEVVALKVMAVQDDAKQQWEKLKRRTSELSQLKHPNIVRYYGCFSEQGPFNDIHVVVQEFLSGETLKDRLAKSKSGLDVDEGIKIADAALSGLEYISRCGIVHRDIKPGNIFLCNDGSVKLIDFEISKQRGGTTTSTAGNIRGSFDYMAPDFTDPDFHGDERSDVFSMGVVVHEILTGKTPYQRLDGDSKQANFAFLSRWSRALSDGVNPISISSRVKRLLGNASDTLERALNPVREDRFAKFSEFREALSNVKFRTLRNGKNSYRILQFIGKGGFGEVFKARSKSGELVAIKHLLRVSYLQRFEREAKIMKKLDDPSFVRLVDSFTMEVGGTTEAFIVMTFLDGMPGSSLRDAIKKDGLKLEDALIAFRRYAHGLKLMHTAGIFHRDIKPSNLYFPVGYPAKSSIMDFGIARDLSGTATHGQVPGTLDYMPPEVVLTDNRGDSRMDIYALGLCFYEALTGKTGYSRLPGGTASYTAFFERAKSMSAPSFSDPVVASDEELLTLLREMTDPDFERRIKDAGEVEKRICKILESRFPNVTSSDLDSSSPNIEFKTDECDESIPPFDITVPPTEIINPTEITRPVGDINVFDIPISSKRRRSWIWGVVAGFIALIGVGVFIGQDSIRQYLANRSNETAEISFLKNQIGRCVSDEGLLHEEYFDMLQNVQPPQGNRIAEGLAEEKQSLRKAIIATLNENLRIEPVMTRRTRLDRAQNILKTRWTEATISAGDIKSFEKDIEKRKGWSVSIIKNGCSSPVFVDGVEVAPGVKKVMVYEDGHSENGLVSKTGYKSMHLPKDIDGKMYEITEDGFVALPVRFSLPKFESAVHCEIDGRQRNSGETIELSPGYYKCKYTRDTYKSQEVGFSVYPNASVVVPLPENWVHTEEFLDNERKKQAAIDKKIKGIKENLDNLLKYEPIGTRMERLDSALEITSKAVDDGIFNQQLSDSYAEKIKKLKSLVVGKIKNSCGFDFEVSTKKILAGKEELLVYVGSLPKEWYCLAEGYEKRLLPANFEGRTINVSADTFEPAAVLVRKIELEDGVSCYINEKEVKADINLKPGRYSCLYKKHGYKDQVVDFDVRLGVSRNLPTPKNWQAKPILIRVPKLPAGTKCVVDSEITVYDELKLLPGKHSCVYSRPDYKSQAFDFSIDSVDSAELPAPTNWKHSEGVERLMKAEEALKKGDLDSAKTALAFADVVTEENQERKKKLQKRISDQSKLSSLVKYAKIYYEDGLYYDTVKCYSQAFKLGWMPSASHSEEYTLAYEKEKKRLQLMIEKCHIDIRLGKTPIRSLEELEKNLRQLTEWYEEFRHLLRREDMVHE